ncbi:hypothetical protein RSOLAG1IB_11430 [Rhizoctonia solani AG-1 IB]|uniref:Uncharacterized protein n=1 Tax=Thanatephorus cucumeris (strain AG1-IB / isolate 7/3/14) TaxID=1108050 RepID=A0A0B7F823_THACB|nr:hypothetical protein RSOLAG1IB_11430 [Rhizoctonia solani AG-1 IB]
MRLRSPERNTKILCTVACINDKAKGTGVINQTLDFYTSALPSFQRLTVAASNAAPCYMRKKLPPPIVYTHYCWIFCSRSRSLYKTNGGRVKLFIHCPRL